MPLHRASACSFHLDRRPVGTLALAAASFAAALIAGSTPARSQGPAAEPALEMRIGVAPAQYETSSGEQRLAPGPYLDIDGRLYVPALRRRLLEREVWMASKPAPRGSRIRSSGGFLNVLVNDPDAQSYGSGNTQMEPALAANGDTLVCGFVDSQGFFGVGTLSGCAWSFDAGRTWTDGGSLPKAGTSPNEMVFGDPSLATDGRGHWYYASVYDIGNGPGPGQGDFGLVLHRGHFAGGTMHWTGPWLFAGGGVGGALDAPSLVIDAARDRLYAGYTNFSVPQLEGWGQIEVVTLTNLGTQVANACIVQPEVLQHNNAGARLAVGPGGEVYCAWESDVLSGLGQGPAWQMVARSLDFGATFEPGVVAGQVIESWFSWPPGSNRNVTCPEYPAIAVDCSSGPHRGRVYLAWQDGVSMDFTGTLTPVSETTGSNDTPQAAQVLPSGVSHWQISGSLPSGDPVDWYRFSGNAGEHVRMFLQPGGALSVRLRLLAANPTGGGADTVLAQSALGAGQLAFFLFSLPTTGDYYVSVERRLPTSGSYTAYLRKTTVTLPSVAIDHRDIVLVSSPDGVGGWTAKRRLDDDTGFTDQALPDLVVDGCGGLHACWYDRRFDPRCRVLADVVLASSYDGGASFRPNVRLTTGSSFWQVPADASPNFGDYVAMAAGDLRLFVPWTDGRRGDPDIMMAPVPLCQASLALPETLRARPGHDLGLGIGVANGALCDDAFQVALQSGCSLFPDTSFAIQTLAGGSDSTLLYDPPVDERIHTIAPCTITVVVTSQRSGCVYRDSVRVINDTVPVEVADFAVTRAGGVVRLAWRAASGARFDVERALDPGGTWMRLTPEPLAAGPGGRCEFADRGAARERSYAYRLVEQGTKGERRAFGPYWVDAELPPRRLALHEAWPNPFNPGTVLRFDLPRPGRVTLRILDARGREVVPLLDAVRRDSGSQQTTWDGRDAAGVAMPSGVYLAELRALGERRTARLVLLR